VTTVGIVCPGFGLVSDESPGEDASGAPPAVHRCDDLTMGLGTDPACVKAARDHTAAVLAAWGLNGQIPNATLVVSELVTNVLRDASRRRNGGDQRAATGAARP
jgi:hypothetical protein